jgi:hypothetical protein
MDFLTDRAAEPMITVEQHFVLDLMRVLAHAKFDRPVQPEARNWRPAPRMTGATSHAPIEATGGKKSRHRHSSAFYSTR